MSALTAALSGGFIVSVQASAGSALDDPAVLAAMAAAAVEGGAAAVRIQGEANVRAVRERVAVPVIGLIKRTYDGFEPYITAGCAEVEAVIAAGADIVAFDATARPRPDGSDVAALVALITAHGRAAMADCADAQDGLRADAAGAQIIATTLAGYTPHTEGRRLPALDLLSAWDACRALRICEGGVHSPQAAARAMQAGADAVVVGTAITNLGWVTRRYVQAISAVPRRKSWPS